MKLTVINGSPRGTKSNSTRIVQTWIFPESAIEMVYAKDILKDENVLLNTEVEGYLIIFPLYVDTVPAIVKGLFEIMEQNKAKFSGKKVWFIIHSGFPEPKHLRLSEKYVRYFAKLLEMQHMGTAVMGNSEGLQAAPNSFYGKKIKLFRLIGENIEKSEPFDQEAVKQISGDEELSKLGIFIMNKFNPSKFYWNGQLKKNGVFDKRFDQPYADKRWET